MFDRFVEGEDIDDYCYTDRYPEIYAKLPEKKSKLVDGIVLLRKLLAEFEQTVSDESDLICFVERLALLLPQIYISATNLPQVANVPDGEVAHVHLGRLNDCSLSPSDPLIKVYNPFTDHTEGSSLIAILCSIRTNIDQELLALTSNDPDEIAIAISALRWSFAGENGWGSDLLQALVEIHSAKQKFADAKRNVRLR